jgi:hypothetical protein
MLTPEGLWVAYRLQLKRTRNPSCFRSNRYFVAWKPGSTPPYPVETLHGYNVPTLGIRSHCPLLSDVSLAQEAVHHRHARYIRRGCDRPLIRRLHVTNPRVSRSSCRGAGHRV